MSKSTKLYSASWHVKAEYKTEHDIREWEYLLEIRRQLLEHSERLARAKSRPKKFIYKDISAKSHRVASDRFWRLGVPQNVYTLTAKEIAEIADAVQNKSTKILRHWIKTYRSKLHSSEYFGENPDPRAAVNPTFALVGFIAEELIPPPEYLLYFALRFHTYLDTDETLGNIFFGKSTSSRLTSTARKRYKLAQRDIAIYEVAQEIRAHEGITKISPLARRTFDRLISTGAVEFDSPDSIEKIIRRWDEIVADYDEIPALNGADSDKS